MEKQEKRSNKIEKWKLIKIQWKIRQVEKWNGEWKNGMKKSKNEKLKNGMEKWNGKT